MSYLDVPPYWNDRGRKSKLSLFCWGLWTFLYGFCAGLGLGLLQDKIVRWLGF